MVKSLKDKNHSSSVTSLTKLLTGQSSTLENIPALQYGYEMEEEARQHYLQEMKSFGHKDVKVEPSGLFVMQNKSFIGASPDAVVSCDKRISSYHHKADNFKTHLIHNSNVAMLRTEQPNAHSDAKITTKLITSCKLNE